MTSAQAERDAVVAEAILRIAQIAEAVGWQAGVGASETAGQIVSYLAAHPEHIATVMQGGLLDLPPDWWENGCLTWMAMNGNIVRPQQARFAKIVRKLERGDHHKGTPDE